MLLPALDLQFVVFMVMLFSVSRFEGLENENLPPHQCRESSCKCVDSLATYSKASATS